MTRSASALLCFIVLFVLCSACHPSSGAQECILEVFVKVFGGTTNEPDDEGSTGREQGFPLTMKMARSGEGQGPPPVVFVRAERGSVISLQSVATSRTCYVMDSREGFEERLTISWYRVVNVLFPDGSEIVSKPNRVYPTKGGDLHVRIDNDAQSTLICAEVTSEVWKELRYPCLGVSEGGTECRDELDPEGTYLSLGPSGSKVPFRPSDWNRNGTEGAGVPANMQFRLQALERDMTSVAFAKGCVEVDSPKTRTISLEGVQDRWSGFTDRNKRDGLSSLWVDASGITADPPGELSDGELSYVWTVGNHLLGRQRKVLLRLKEGTHYVTLRVLDEKTGYKAQKEIEVRVDPYPNTPPEVRLVTPLTPSVVSVDRAWWFGKEAAGRKPHPFHPVPRCETKGRMRKKRDVLGPKCIARAEAVDPEGDDVTGAWSPIAGAKDPELWGRPHRCDRDGPAPSGGVISETGDLTVYAPSEPGVHEFEYRSCDIHGACTCVTTGFTVFVRSPEWVNRTIGGNVGGGVPSMRVVERVKDAHTKALLHLNRWASDFMLYSGSLGYRWSSKYLPGDRGKNDCPFDVTKRAEPYSAMTTCNIAVIFQCPEGSKERLLEVDLQVMVVLDTRFDHHDEEGQRQCANTAPSSIRFKITTPTKMAGGKAGFSVPHDSDPRTDTATVGFALTPEPEMNVVPSGIRIEWRLWRRTGDGSEVEVEGLVLGRAKPLGPDTDRVVFGLSAGTYVLKCSLDCRSTRLPGPGGEEIEESLAGFPIVLERSLEILPEPNLPPFAQAQFRIGSCINSKLDKDGFSESDTWRCVVRLTSIGSHDPDGDPISYSWISGEGGTGVVGVDGLPVGNKATVLAAMKVGTNLVALEVSDTYGAKARYPRDGWMRINVPIPKRARTSGPSIAVEVPDPGMKARGSTGPEGRLPVKVVCWSGGFDIQPGEERACLLDASRSRSLDGSALSFHWSSKGTKCKAEPGDHPTLVAFDPTSPVALVAFKATPPLSLSSCTIEVSLSVFDAHFVSSTHDFEVVVAWGPGVVLVPSAGPDSPRADALRLSMDTPDESFHSGRRARETQALPATLSFPKQEIASLGRDPSVRSLLDRCRINAAGPPGEGPVPQPRCDPSCARKSATMVKSISEDVGACVCEDTIALNGGVSPDRTIEVCCDLALRVGYRPSGTDRVGGESPFWISRCKKMKMNTKGPKHPTVPSTEPLHAGERSKGPSASPSPDHRNLGNGNAQGHQMEAGERETIAEAKKKAIPEEKPPEQKKKGVEDSLRPLAGSESKPKSKTHFLGVLSAIYDLRGGTVKDEVPLDDLAGDERDDAHHGPIAVFSIAAMMIILLVLVVVWKKRGAFRGLVQIKTE